MIPAKTGTLVAVGPVAPGSAAFRVAYYQHGKETHAYNEKWVTTDYFCPNCGKKSVWVEDDPGDYHQGPSYLCTACAHDFTMPSGPCDQRESEQGKQRLAALPNVTDETRA